MRKIVLLLVLLAYSSLSFAAEYPPVPTNRSEALAELKKVFPYQKEFNTGWFRNVCTDIGKKSSGLSDVSNQYTIRVVDLYFALGKEFSPSECLYNYMSMRGNSMDSYTTEEGALNIVSFLVKGRHADPNYKPKDKIYFGSESDLTLTKSLIYPSVFKFLVENGANIKEGRTFVSTTKQRFTLNGGGNIKSKNWTILHDLAFFPPETNAAEVLDIALGKGININAKTECGLTPLGAALLNLNLDMMKLLIARGANVNATIAANNTSYTVQGDGCVFAGSILNVAKTMANKEAEIILEDAGAKVITPKEAMAAEKGKEQPVKPKKKGK